MNADRMCRVCETVHELKDLFEEENEELLHMLRCIANITIKKDDLLPKNICNYCSYRLQMAYDFKIQCEVTDQSMRAMLENIEVKISTLQDVSCDEVPNKLSIDPLCDSIKVESEQIDVYIIETEPNFDQVTVKDDDISNSELIQNNNGEIDDEHVEKDVDTVVENYKSDFLQERELLEGDLNNFEAEFLDQSMPVESSVSEENNMEADTVESVMTSETDSNHVSSTSEVKRKNPPQRQSSRTFTCNRCSATFTNYIEFTAHKKTHGRPRFQCTICDKTFARRAGLKDHIANHSGSNRMQCHLCTKQCSNRGNLYRHITQCHEKIKPFPCEICGVRFARRSAVREHAATHSEIRNYACDVCDKKFKTVIYLNAHKRIHMPADERRKLLPYKPPKRQLYVCETCGKKSFTLACHITHKKIHSDVKPFVCELCPKSFHFKNSLLTHMLCHTGEKPYACDVCGKGFRQVAHVTTHKLGVHEQAKRHKCRYCEKAFSSAGTLRVHERIHTGEKPYECALCPLRFIDANGLRKHRMKLHADDYKPRRTKTMNTINFTSDDTMNTVVFDQENLTAICENDIGVLSMDPGHMVSDQDLVVDQFNVYLDELHHDYTEVIVN